MLGFMDAPAQVFCTRLWLRLLFQPLRQDHLLVQRPYGASKGTVQILVNGDINQFGGIGVAD